MFSIASHCFSIYENREKWFVIQISLKCLKRFVVLFLWSVRKRLLFFAEAVKDGTMNSLAIYVYTCVNAYTPDVSSLNVYGIHKMKIFSALNSIIEKLLYT